MSYYEFFVEAKIKLILDNLATSNIQEFTKEPRYEILVTNDKGLISNAGSNNSLESIEPSFGGVEKIATPTCYP